MPKQQYHEIGTSELRTQHENRDQWLQERLCRVDPKDHLAAAMNSATPIIFEQFIALTKIETLETFSDLWLAEIKLLVQHQVVYRANIAT
jgi:hypothetical protein